jgi:Zn ribbon nucleic-acid-binding protein
MDAADRRRHADAVTPLLRDGERLILRYDRDLAGCECPTQHVYAGVDTIAVGRRDDVAHDRCLACWTVWRRRDDRRDPLVVLLHGPAHLGRARTPISKETHDRRRRRPRP